jgi:hypothetical protein
MGAGARAVLSLRRDRIYAGYLLSPPHRHPTRAVLPAAPW